MKNRKDKRRVVFTFSEPSAQEVALAGDFNQWQYDQSPMKKSKKGQWTKTLYLEPGTYEYKYRVDGTWMVDDENPDQCPNGFGTRNNRITVVPK